MPTRLIYPFLLLIALTLAACDVIEGFSQGETAVTATPPILETAEATAVALTQSTPETTIPITPSVPAQQLTIWIPPRIAAPNENAATLFAEQLRIFQEKHPELILRFEQKAFGGQGGILSYLRSGREVAPTVVPDVVVLPTHMLSSATAETLIFPLNEQLTDNDLESLYPAARELVQPDDQILGYPLVLNDLPHLVYNSNVITETLPLTWNRLIADPERTMLFAADGEEGALLALQFYLDANGKLVNDDGQNILELDPLITALEQLQDGREAGFIAPQSSTIVSIDQSWQAFLGGIGNIVRTNADHFMQQDTGELSLGYTVTAGVDRPLTPLVSGWAWAVSTTDPSKKALATELILELTEASNLGPWSLESKMLPAHSDAFDIWIQEDNAYYSFIGQELQRAQPLRVAPSSKTITVLADAVFQVVSGAKTAQQAAQDAVNEM